MKLRDRPPGQWADPARKIFGYHGRKEPGNEELLRTRGGLLYYLYDRLGTVVALTDRQGEVVTRYYYDVFSDIHMQVTFGAGPALGAGVSSSAGGGVSNADNGEALTGLGLSLMVLLEQVLL